MTPYLHILHHPEYFGPEWWFQFRAFLVPFVIALSILAMGKAGISFWDRSQIFWKK